MDPGSRSLRFLDHHPGSRSEAQAVRDPFRNIAAAPAAQEPVRAYASPRFAIIASGDGILPRKAV